MNRITLSIALSLALAACKKDEAKDSEKPASKPAAEEPAPAPKKPAGPFAGWDLDARIAALQGAHVTPGGSLGTWEAWNVAGDKVTVWDGTTEKTLELAVLSPCEVKVTERGDDGSSSSTISDFTLKDGAIVKGLGDAGSWRGKEAVACVSSKVFTLDAAGTCLEWERSMFDDEYESKPGTCGWKTEGGAQVFVATVNGRETTLQIHGDALLSEQLARVHSEKVADFAAAKAARDAK